jgi:hypothetical protein
VINFGPVPAGSVLPVFFGSYDANGASVALTGLAVTDIEIYKGVSITQRSSDAGYALIDTDGIDVDGVTGLNAFSIDTGDNTDSGFYAVGSFYTVVVSAVTIDSQTVNFVAATFSIRAAEHTAGYPVVTIKDGTGTGEIDTTSGGVLVAAIAANAITATAIASDAITDAKVASDVTIASVTGAVGSVTGAVGSVTGAVGSVTGNVGGNVTGSVGSIATGGITTASFAAGAINAAAIANNAIDAATFAADVDAEFLSYIVDDATRIDASALNTLSGHDPGETIMGATDLGTGSGLTALATQASVNTIDDFLDTEVAAILAAVDTEVGAIKTKTDQLTFGVANTLNSNVTYVNETQVDGVGSEADPWGPA